MYDNCGQITLQVCQMHKPDLVFNRDLRMILSNNINENQKLSMLMFQLITYNQDLGWHLLPKTFFNCTI